MRVNVYAEEMTDHVEIISKEIEGQQFTGLRLYLHLPVTQGDKQIQGPFMHHPGDDDSSAVTFWGKKDLREVLVKALAKLDEHYGERHPRPKPEARLYYECHVSILREPPQNTEKLAQVSKNCGFKLAEFYLKKNGIEEAVMTSKHTDYKILESRMKTLVDFLNSQGFIVVRYKIEDTVFDSKHGDRIKGVS